MLPFSENTFQKMPIIGILRGYSPEKTLKIIDCYFEAGFTTIEVTLNTPKALTTIKKAVETYGKNGNIGAGTVCNEADLKAALMSGSQFIVSPITDIAMIEACIAIGIPIFPGAFTPTEIYQTWTAGARMVKVFPAGLLGPKYIKEVLAPLNQIELMPTGGVSFENIEAYHRAGAKAYGMGSLLFDKQLIQAENWSKLTQQLKSTKSKIEAILF